MVGLPVSIVRGEKLGLALALMVGSALGYGLLDGSIVGIGDIEGCSLLVGLPVSIAGNKVGEPDVCFGMDGVAEGAKDMKVGTGGTTGAFFGGNTGAFFGGN